MKTGIIQRIIVFAGSIFLFGLVNCAHARLTDVETAIIRQDYIQAQKLAKEMLSGKQNKKLNSKIQYYLGLSQLRQGQLKQARATFKRIRKNGIDSQLRDKIGSEFDAILPATGGAQKSVPHAVSPVSDAVSALVSLGYKAQEASRMVRSIESEGLSTEEIIRASLQGSVK